MSILVTCFDMSLLKLDLDAVAVYSQKNAQAMTKGGSADGALRLLSTMRTEALFTIATVESTEKNGQISIDFPCVLLQINICSLRRCSFSCIFQPSRSLAHHHCSLRDLWRTWTLTTRTMEKKRGIGWHFFHVFLSTSLRPYESC